MDTNLTISRNHGEAGMHDRAVSIAAGSMSARSVRFGRRRIFFHVSILAIILALSALSIPSFAGDVNLSWDPVAASNLAGYKVNYGTASGAYGMPIPVGNITSYIVTGLASGTYYFAVTAFDTSGSISGYSNEVSAVVSATSPTDTTPPVVSSVSSGSVTSTSAILTWSTSEQSDSQVEYGPSTAYGSITALDPTMVTSHSQALGGLTAGTTYHYRVQSKDAAGNLGASGDFMLTTTAAQGAGDVNLSWDSVTASNLAGYKVFYGTASRAYGTSIPVGNITSYTVTGLSSGTYYLAVAAFDTSGAVSNYSNEVSTAVGAPSPTDTTPPVVSAVSSGSVTPTSAIVSWATSEQSDSQVEYGPSTAYGSITALDPTMVTSHSQALGGLTAGTTYHYRVKSKDSAGNLGASGDFTLTTTSAADSTAPLISGVSGGSVTSNSAVVAWTTGEQSDGQVEYGTSTAYGSITALNLTMATLHSQALSGLTAKTTYHYRVKSKDAAGNLATSGDFTLTTSEAPINVGLVAAYAFDEGTGTTAEDSSGNSNTGTLFNCEWTSGGKYGKALVFDGQERYVSAPASGLPAMNSPQTIAYWFYENSKTSQTRPVVSLVNDSENTSTQAGFKSAKVGVWQNTGTWLVPCAQPSAKAWHHYAYTYDGQTHVFYIDGEQVSSSTIAPSAAATNRLLIGKMIVASDYLRGILDELRIYNRALSQAEVATLMTLAVGN